MTRSRSTFSSLHELQLGILGDDHAGLVLTHYRPPRTAPSLYRTVEFGRTVNGIISRANTQRALVCSLTACMVGLLVFLFIVSVKTNYPLNG